jgi:hypothetical protein
MTTARPARRTHDELDDNLVLKAEQALRLLDDPRPEDARVDLLEVNLLGKVGREGGRSKELLVLVAEAAVVLDLAWPARRAKRRRRTKSGGSVSPWRRSNGRAGVRLAQEAREKGEPSCSTCWAGLEMVDGHGVGRQESPTGSRGGTGRGWRGSDWSASAVRITSRRDSHCSTSTGSQSTISSCLFALIRPRCVSFPRSLRSPSRSPPRPGRSRARSPTARPSRTGPPAPSAPAPCSTAASAPPSSAPTAPSSCPSLRGARPSCLSWPSRWPQQLDNELADHLARLNPRSDDVAPGLHTLTLGCPAYKFHPVRRLLSPSSRPDGP